MGLHVLQNSRTRSCCYCQHVLLLPRFYGHCSYCYDHVVVLSSIHLLQVLQRKIFRFRLRWNHGWGQEIVPKARPCLPLLGRIKISNFILILQNSRHWFLGWYPWIPPMADPQHCLLASWGNQNSPFRTYCFMETSHSMERKPKGEHATLVLRCCWCWNYGGNSRRSLHQQIPNPKKLVRRARGWRRVKLLSLFID